MSMRTQKKQQEKMMKIEDAISIVKEMINDEGDTWDLSPNDKEALAALIGMEKQAAKLIYRSHEYIKKAKPALENHTEIVDLLMKAKMVMESDEPMIAERSVYSVQIESLLVRLKVV